MLLPRIERRIVDLVHDNYSIPVAQHKRKVRSGAQSKLGSDGLYYRDEADYEDAWIPPAIQIDVRAFSAITDNTQVKTLAKINALITLLLSGSRVSTAKFKSVLTKDQFATYTSNLEQMHHQVEILYGNGMPPELKSYNILLRTADMLFNKYEAMDGQHTYGGKKFKHGAIKKMIGLSEDYYDRALENLEETFGAATIEERETLKAWMDREVVFGLNGNVGPDCDAVPRVRGSKSTYAEDEGLPKLSKLMKREEFMLKALRDAACNIAFIPLQSTSTELSAADTATLREKLNKLKRGK